jgi:acyl carrier protein
VQALEREIKELIISSLVLEDLTPEDIDTDSPLFVEGLGLDSIDALELGLALQKRYQLSLSGNAEQTRAHFASVATLAAFVHAQVAAQNAGSGGDKS